MINNLNDALRYLNKGISIFPVWSPDMISTNPPSYYLEKIESELAKNSIADDPVPDKEIRQKCFIDQCKIPLLKWKDYQDRLPETEEVVTWFTRWPSANIGVVTGKISNLVVFDLDSQKAFDYAKAQGGFPDTVRVKTGKGAHVWMQHPGFFVKPDVNKNLDMDIRGDGGFVVVPPSFHGSGSQYQWIKNYSLNNIEIAPCSDWNIQYLKENATGKKKPASKTSKVLKKSNTSSIQNSEISELIKNGCKEGERNQGATKIAGSLIKTNKDTAVAWELFKIWNSRNYPPLAESELRGVFDSIAALEGQNKQTKEEIKIDISTLLDTQDKIVSEYKRNNIVIPFAGDNLATLETKMNGGLQCGCLYIIGGIPSAGKTKLSNNIADNICFGGHPVLFFSYDDTKSEIRNRTFARFAKQDIESFNKKILSDDFIKQLCYSEDIKRITEYKYVVQDSIPINKWSDLIVQLVRKHQKSPVIVVDYLRKLKLEKSNSDERLRVDSILTYLTDLAKKHNVPILAISELARDSYKSGQRLSMASFKESGTIEYEASWLGILAAVEERNGAYHLKSNWERIIEHDGNVDLIIYKAKRGTGSTGKVQLKFNKKYMTATERFDDAGFVQPKKRK